MMARHISRVPALILLLGVFFLAAGCREDVQRVSKETLRAHLDDPSWIIIDTRLATDWTASEGQIPGSHRENPVEVDRWSEKYSKEKTLVTYCA